MVYDVNIRLVFGVLNVGIGYIYVNLFLLCLDIFIVNYVIFKIREREVGRVVEFVVNESCVVSCCKEREMVMEVGVECDLENLVGVMCLYDMGW